MIRIKTGMNAMRALTLICLAGLTLLVAACAGAGPTPYQPASRPGAQGYSEQQVAEDRFRIVVTGNALTSRERVEDYLLYRASELTLGEGYDHFLLLERQTDSNTLRYYESWPSPMWGPGWAWQPYWGGYYGGRSHMGVGMGMSMGGGQETRYSTSALVRMYHGSPPADLGPIYEARTVMADLEPVVHPPPQR